MRASVRLVLGTLLLAGAVGLTVLLLRGDALLLRPLPFGLPVGNAMAAAILAAPAAAVLVLPGGATVLRRVALGLLGAGCVWLPASCLLAGNPRFVFTGAQTTTRNLWLLLTALLALANLALLAWRGVALLRQPSEDGR